MPETAALLAAVLFLLSGVQAQDVAQLARAYAGNPTPANRTALLDYAASHKDRSGGIALLAVAAQDAAANRQSDVQTNLHTARERLPQIADYIDFIRANDSFEQHDFSSAASQSESVLKHQLKSPVLGAAALIAAKAYISANTPPRAIEVLVRHHNDLPQPDGDATLAAAYDAAHDAANAVTYNQRVWLDYPASVEAATADTDLKRLAAELGNEYHAPQPAALLNRATKLMDARRYDQARAEFAALAGSAPPAIRDIALVRVGAAEQHTHRATAALTYSQSLKVEAPVADAERMYYIVSAARRLNRTDVMNEALDQLARKYPASEWRLEALVAVANEYFLVNQPAAAEPLFTACYQQFPKSAQAPYCHWRVAFEAYLHDRADAADLLKAHLRLYSNSGNGSGALYFLGRLAERASNWAEARAWYDQLAQLFPNYYYGVLGRTRLAEAEVSKAAPSQAPAELLRGLVFPGRALPATFQPLPSSLTRFERASLLRAAALDDYAEMELRFGAKTGDQPEAFGLELARTASARSAPNRAIRYLKVYAPGYLSAPLASAPREFWTLSFPLPWRESLERYAKANDLDPFVVAALIRQESEFNPRAVSRARAYGLTQVLPSTGRDVSRRMGLRNFSSKSLFDPDINLRIGTQYLKRLLNQFNGEWEPALASYNAGKGRAVAWLGRANFREPAEFVESIPFTETRNYVQIVLRDADLYRRLYQVQKDTGN